jgi:hypothetical protein
MMNPPRASLGLSSPVCWLAVCRGLPLIDLSLSYRALCVVVLLPNPFPPLLPRSSTTGRYFPSGLCRITLNLFFLLLNIP